MAIGDIVSLGGRDTSPEAEPWIDPHHDSTWSSQAPLDVVELYRAGDDATAWRKWTKHFSRRHRRRDLRRSLARLFWGTLDEPRFDNAERHIQNLISKQSAAGENLSAQTDIVSPGATVEYIADCLVLAQARDFEAAAWWEHLGATLAVFRDARATVLEADPLAHQWLSGELPLTLAALFPEIEPCRQLAAPAGEALSRGLIDLLDGEGALHARHLHLLRPLLACWTRCRLLLPQGQLPWNDEAEEQYEFLLRQVLRLTRRNGTLAFSESSAADTALLRAARELITDEADRRLASKLWLRKSSKSRGNGTLPEAANNSEWAETAVLRPDWSPGCQRLTVTFHDRQVRFELSRGRDVLWSGDWGLQVQFDEERRELTRDWEQVCWVSDEDVDYLEVEAPLTGGLRVQRQMLLAREDDILFIADAILGQQPGQIKYLSTLPLAEGISFTPAVETREGLLEGGKYRALIMPLALPEWRQDSRVGQLQMGPAGLELQQSVSGRCLFAPLWIDLRPKRILKPCTWRHLTVADMRQIQPPDVAAGYRVQVGDKHWLVYRSLAVRGNRTLLGHNISTEFLLGKFGRDGEVRTLLELE